METICALATPMGKGGIAVIRVSGDDAIALCEKIIVPKRMPLSACKAGRMYLCVMEHKGERIDDGMVCVFRAPHSFTGEDTVEINCHGGMFIVRRILEALIESGCRAAGAGEFSKRAFLNGKMDLTQAEAVIDLIDAESKLQAVSALGQLDGRLRQKIERADALLREVSEELIAYVDYPEETIGEIDPDTMLERVSRAEEILLSLCRTFSAGRLIRDGVQTAIIGRPNVGKSTLMNLMVGREKSIVTDIAGTTRDLIEETVSFGDASLHLVDTAGMHSTQDKVEQMGVERAREAAEKAGLLLAVIDGSEPLTEQDREVLSLCRDKLSVLIVNKTDKGCVADIESVASDFAAVVQMSAKHEDAAKLEAVVRDLLWKDGLPQAEEIVTNARQMEALERARQSVQAAKQTMLDGYTPDLMLGDLTEAVASLGETTGRQVSMEMIDAVFSRFCVGK